ncbi:hypothetical protein PInf_017151 [Phytophthora infestans]|nr:hypothetical protein PInf_017151 [Phytophthora infestans]
MVRGLQRLFNGVAQTNKEKEMWLGRFGDAGVLVIRFQRSHIACTRDVEVLVSGKTVWTGSLPETFGDEDDNICTWIDLLGSAKKTSRTSRNEKSSVSSERHLTTRVDETNAAKRETIQWQYNQSSTTGEAALQYSKYFKGCERGFYKR